MAEKRIVAALWSFTRQLSLFYVAVMLALAWWLPKDDTDPSGGRSGLMIRTDALTGCQYLTTARGGLTPRVDRNGAPMCAQKETP